VAAAALKVPGAQESQAGCEVARVYRPAAQSVHTVAAVAEYFPAEQPAQRVFPAKFM
jgi:hypothetical protein